MFSDMVITKQPGYEIKDARVKELKRFKRRGMPDPTLGRVPRGADIASAEMDRDNYATISWK